MEQLNLQPIIDPDHAETARQLLIDHGEHPTPSHVFLMTERKGSSAHLVLDPEGNPIATAISFIQINQQNQPELVTTHLAGQDDALNLALSQIEQNAQLLDFEPLDHELADIYTPEKLDFTVLDFENFTLQASLKNGQEVVIRPPNPNDLAEIENVQINAWGMDPKDPNSISNLVTSADLDMFNRDDHTMLVAEVNDEIVSFVFGFLGLSNNRIVLNSHMAATLKDFQSQGVMQIIKKAQIILAAQLGITEIHWTYDPSYEQEVANHSLNINTFDASVAKYIINAYANTANATKAYSKGLNSVEESVTDRFEVVQRLHDPAFARHILGIEKKPKIDIDSARSLPPARPDSTQGILKYPLRPEAQDKTQYVLDMRETFDTLINSGQYEVTNVATDFQKGQITTEAYFILERVK